MSNEWIDGPKFVKWLETECPNAMSNSLSTFGVNDHHNLTRAREGATIGFNIADRICCEVGLHLDSGMPEEAWTKNPHGRQNTPQGIEARRLFREGKHASEVSEITGLTLEYCWELGKKIREQA